MRPGSVVCCIPGGILDPTGRACLPKGGKRPRKTPTLGKAIRSGRGCSVVLKAMTGLISLNSIAFNKAASEAFLERAANPPGDTESRDHLFQHYNIRTRNLHKLDPTCSH